MVKNRFLRSVAVLCFLSALLYCPITQAKVSRYGWYDRAYWGGDPTLKIFLSTHFMMVDGTAYARENAVERYYMSSTMPALDVDDNLGISSMMIYIAGLAWNPGGRHHIEVNYMYGEASGQGWYGSPVGFNDSAYSRPGETEGELIIDSLQIGYYYRVVDTITDWGVYRLDTGLGVENARVYETFGIENNYSDPGTEAVFAPLLPYVFVISELYPRPGYLLGTRLEANFSSWPDKALTELPADGSLYKADLYAGFPVGDMVSGRMGISLWNMEVAFNGVETNHKDHVADNEVELWFTGAYVSFYFDDPQEVVIEAYRTFTRMLK